MTQGTDSMRTVSFAGSHVDVRCEGDAAKAVVDFLFAGLPLPTGEPLSASLACYRIAGEAATMSLTRDGTLLARGARERIADVLLSDATRTLIDPMAGGMAIHCGGFGNRGRGVLAPAISGSGKSTLTALAIAAGFHCLSDELVHVPLGSRSAAGFARPLSLKEGAGAVLGSLPVVDDGREIWECGTGWLVSQGRLGPAVTPPELTIDVLMFVHFQPGAPLEFETIPRARAASLLLQNVLNARNLPAHGLPEAARVARGVEAALELRYGDADQLGPVFAKLRALLAAPASV
jgi:hypothetical protein